MSKAEPIATRTYDLLADGNVVAEIYAPVAASDDDWSCDVVLRGLQKEVRTKAHGVDAVQALELALQAIRFHLESSNEAFRFEDGEENDSLIAPALPSSYGLAFRKQLEGLVARETQKFVDAELLRRREADDHAMIASEIDDETRIWNRAALQKGGASPGEGDAALTAAIQFNGLAMNGGVVHAFEVLRGEELHAACAGFRYFGLDQAAALIETAFKMEWEDESSVEMDRIYGELVENDALGRAFRSHFATHPERYAKSARR